MKAIMLSYDNNHKYCELTYRMYMGLWPECPYHFYIPWNEREPKYFIDKPNVTLVQCSSRILPTMQALLADVEDDDWIYWCIDDRFPVHIDVSGMEQLHDQLHDYDEFDFVRPFHPPASSEKLMKKSLMFNSNDEYKIQSSGQQWGYYMHHYCKAYMLKRIYFIGDLDTIDDFHVYVNNDTIDNTVGLMRSSVELDFIKFREPLIDGRETPAGSEYLSKLNITPNITTKRSADGTDSLISNIRVMKYNSNNKAC